MKQSVNIPNAPAPIGPYSPAIIAGNQLFVSGQIPLDPIEGTFKNETIEEATRQVMEKHKEYCVCCRIHDERGGEMHYILERFK